jgi:signal transduction histidine kinase
MKRGFAFLRAHIQYLWKRLFDFLLSVDVRLKIMGIAIGVVVLFGVASTLFLQVYLKPILVNELRERAISIARGSATKIADFILVNDLFGLHELLRETVERNMDVRYLFVVDTRGGVLIDTFDGALPDGLLTANAVEGSQPFSLVALQSDEGRLYDIAHPIFDGRLGVLRLGASERRLLMQLDDVTRNLMFLTGIASLAGIGAAYLLTYFLTQPILSLMKATLAVQDGDFSQQVQVSTSDEFGQLGHAFNAMTKKLAAAEAQRTSLIKRILTAQEEERARIARDLHDHTGQSLSSLLIRLKGIETAVSLDEARRLTDELRTVVAETLNDVRALAFQTHPSILDDLGLAATLRKDARSLSEKFRVNVDCHVAAIENERLPFEVEVALYRIVREALSNVVRHAKAKNVSILVQRRAQTVLAIVEDDGVGFDTDVVLASDAEKRFGLLGMDERARLVGGRVTIESSPEAGTTAYVEIPLPDQGNGEEP